MELPSITTPARSIGERIRKARKTRGLSQADLALRIGVSQPAIANWESGIHDPRRLTLAKLADALQTSLEWLAAGDRSAFETDKHGAAAYIRRPLQHVPVISNRAAALLGRDITADPHAMAEDYIPVTAGASKLFAVFANDEAVDLVFPSGALVVIDYADRSPNERSFCMASIAGTPVIRRWRNAPRRLEPASSNPEISAIDVDHAVSIIGCVRLSIRIH